MSTELTTFAMSDELRAMLADEGIDNSDLSAGIAASFPVLSFRGKVFRVRYQGEATPVLDKGEPVPALLCVLVAANPQISKIYYPGNYEEGSSDAPTCFSLDGIMPDQSAEKPQATSCAGCQHSVWGSRITEQGSKAKACADSRRVAVVPYPDIQNETYGGPMLLRIPPASFKELVRYSDHLTQIGTPFSAVVTKISFDTEASYPKLVMREMRALTTAEYQQIKELRDRESVQRMLSATEGAIAEVAPDSPGAGAAAEAPAAPSVVAPVETPAPVATDEPTRGQKAAATRARNKAAKEAAPTNGAMEPPVPAPMPTAAAPSPSAQMEALKKQMAALQASEDEKAAPTPEPAATPAEAAADTGVTLPDELASLVTKLQA